jgi:hypothetical protein
LLHGEEFASKALLGNIALLHTDESVSIAQLGEAMLAAALLACHQAGSIRLVAKRGKALLGLRKVNRLCAEPGHRDVAWPAGSVEAAVSQFATRYAKEDSREVRDMVYEWLAQDSASPWQEVIERVKAGLADRGFLERFEEKRLKIFTVTRYELPTATAALAAGQSTEPIRELLDGFEPALWKLLVSELKAAIRRRTEQSDADD